MRGAVGVEGVGVVERLLGPSPEKSHFCVHKMMFRYILMQFLTGRKHGQSLEALEHAFTVQLQNEAYKNSAKFIQKLTSDHRRGQSHHPTIPPEYATGRNVHLTTTVYRSMRMQNQHEK